MKKIVMLVSALVAAANVMAATPTSANSSWAKVFADRDLAVVAPFANELGAQGIFGACATETEIKTIAPQKVCVQMAAVPGTGNSDIDYPQQYECVRYAEKTLSIPRKGLEKKCVEYGTEIIGDTSYAVCTKFGKAPYEISLTQSVDVIYSSGENYPNVAFTKSFTIPACAQ